MPLIFKLAWFCVAHLPFILPAVVGSSKKMKTAQEVVSEYEIDATKYCIYDRDILLKPEIKKIFCLNEMELQSRMQAKSIMHEYKLWGKDWGFPLNSFEASKEIRIWHGINVTSTTIYMGRYLSQEIGCPIHEIQGGHMVYFSIFEDVLSWLCNS